MLYTTTSANSGLKDDWQLKFYEKVLATNQNTQALAPKGLEACGNPVRLDVPVSIRSLGLGRGTGSATTRVVLALLSLSFGWEIEQICSKERL